ncbi:hypothetical protein ACFWD1_07235 [Micromonospora chalcea]
MAALTAVARHWVVSARGTDASATEFWFTGRRRALDLIGEFTRERRPGLLVVTGMPGAGKSAILGVCVLRSLAPSAMPEAIRLSTPKCSIDVAVHARGKDADTVLAEVLRGLDAQSNAVEIRDRIDETIERGATPVCVIDAIDEAEDPDGVAEAVGWLSRRATTVIAVRPHAPAATNSEVQLPASLQIWHPIVIDLDRDEHASARDVATYVARRLRADTGRPDGYGTTTWEMDVLVDVIGGEVHEEVAAGNFLVAQLVTEEMLVVPVLGDRRRGWSEALHWPRKLEDWIGRDVSRRLGTAGAADARSALAPVAQSLRGGLPLDLWRVLLPMFGSTGNPDLTIASVTRQLGFYLTTPAPGRYAMRHQQFARHFAAGLPPGRGDEIFVGVLVDRVPRAGGERPNWAKAEAYTVLNLLGHAHGARLLGAVIDDYPACLARVDRLSATTVLSSAVEPQCRAAADVLRRAAYESSDDYGRRAAALQAHAALAGHDELAKALLDQAGPHLPWSVRWSAGAPDTSPIAVGVARRCQAVIPVAAGAAAEPPSVIFAHADGRCSLHEAASGHELAPDITIGPIAATPPVLHAWRTPTGLVRLAVGWPDGRIAVWALTGRAAGSVIWHCSIGAELSDLVRIPGPQGTDLIAALAGGALTVHPLRPSESAAPTPLLQDRCSASLILPLEPAGGAAAFLTAGADADLIAWRIGSTIQSSVHAGLRSGTIVAGGDADQACVLSNAGESVEAVWLSAQLRDTGLPERLDDGGRTVPIALAVHRGTATAALADGNGIVQVFRLRPGVPASPIGHHDTGHVPYRLAFADPRATTLAVGGWSGSITILRSAVQGRPAVLRMQHGEPAVDLVPLGETDQSMLMASRGITGLARVWSVLASSGAAAEPPVTSVTAVAADERQLLLVAASAGAERLRCWAVDPGRGRAEALPDIHHLGGASVVTAARLGGRAWLATAGETGTVLWTVTERLDVRIEDTYPADQPDVEHVVLGANPRLVLGTAGPEHLRLRIASGPKLVDPEDECVTALVAEQIGDRLLVAAGNDDGEVRIVEFDAPAVRTVHQGRPVAAVALLLVGGNLTIVAADRYNGLVAVPETAIEGTPWQISHLVTVPASRGRRLFGVADRPPRLLSWVIGEDGRLRLDRTLSGELRGDPRQVARTESAMAVADGGGQLLLVDGDAAEVTAANLNVTIDALAGIPGTEMFVAARGGRLICVARNDGGASAGKSQAAGPG